MMLALFGIRRENHISSPQYSEVTAEAYTTALRPHHRKRRIVVELTDRDGQVIARERLSITEASMLRDALVRSIREVVG